MKTKRIISGLLTLVMLLSSLVIGVEAAWEDKVDANGDPIINYLTQVYETPEQKLADMIMVKEAYGYQLWFEEFTGEIAVVDTTTGQIVFSNPWDLALSSDKYQNISVGVRQQLLSQLIITFLDNGTTKTMNSYTEAALRGQIKKSNIKNGIRVAYSLGEEQTTRLVPRMIRADRFEDLILANITDEFAYDKIMSFYTKKWKDDPNLTDRAVAVMYAKYPITMEMDVYVTEGLTTKELKDAEKYIKQYCPNYTYEELEYDHEITGYVGRDAAPPRFNMALQYTLTETGLEVRLAANSIEFDESRFQFQTVSVLPYFGAGSNQYTGYALIPDGSGTLIRYEDFVQQGVSIVGEMYGPDYAYHEITGQHAEVMRQPYYGLVTNYDELSNPMPGLSSPVDYSAGFLAVITEGDSLASLKAEVGGMSHPYTTVYPCFTPRPSDQYNLADSISVSGSAVWTVTSKRKYTDSYRINYILLRDEDKVEGDGDFYATDWVGMATAYRDFLTEKGDIAKLENVDADIPLFIETFGSIKSTDRVLSFPVEVDMPLTTFENIKTMYEELTELGVGNVNFKLTGYANGGLSATVPYKLSWMDVVGGADGFTDLTKYAIENGFEIYPEFDFAYLNNKQAFDGLNKKAHLVRTIDNRYTSKRTYNAATHTFDNTFSLAISPAAYSYLYETFGPNYLEYGNPSISVSTLGTDLNSDFDEDEPYHREDNKEFTMNLLSAIDRDFENVMINGGNAYAIKYADVILDASLTSSGFTKASEAVPFFGFVYHGSKVFTGSATNMEGDINEAILHAIENGAGMYFILSYQNTSLLKESVETSNYYSVAYEIWKEDIVKYYTLLNEAIRDLQDSYIVGHDFLEGSRIPDADEAEADLIDAEAALNEALEAEAAKRDKEERKQRLKDRLAKEAGTLTDEEEDLIEEEIENLEEELEEEEEAEPGLSLEDFMETEKYKTEIGSIVLVEYEGGVKFILNYNSFDVTVELDGETYTLEALSFERID